MLHKHSLAVCFLTCIYRYIKSMVKHQKLQWNGQQQPKLSLSKINKAGIWQARHLLLNLHTQITLHNAWVLLIIHMPHRAPHHVGGTLLDWSSGSLGSLQFWQRNKVPLKVQAPVKPSTHNWGGAVGESVSTDDVNHRAHHSPAVFSDGSQQRLQPHLIHLTVTVQEHQHCP